MDNQTNTEPLQTDTEPLQTDTEPLASGDGASFRLTREDHLVLGLLQVLARLHALKGHATHADMARLPNLRPFLEAGDRLMQDLGFADE